MWLLTGIRQSQQSLKVFTNGGMQTSNLIGEVWNLGTMWYNPESLANILSLAEVQKKFRVTMDTSFKLALCMHCCDVSIMKFVDSRQDFTILTPILRWLITSWAIRLMPILYHNCSQNQFIYHQREIEAADCAQKLYQMIGQPSIKQFEDILCNNSIHNCPVTIDNVHRAIKIWGLDVAGHKG